MSWVLVSLILLILFTLLLRAPLLSLFLYRPAVVIWWNWFGAGEHSFLQIQLGTPLRRQQSPGGSHRRRHCRTVPLWSSSAMCICICTVVRPPYIQPHGGLFFREKFTAWFVLPQILQWEPTFFYTTVNIIWRNQKLSDLSLKASSSVKLVMCLWICFYLIQSAWPFAWF